MALPDSTTYPKPPGQERSYPKPTKTGRAPFKIPNHDLHGETAFEIYGDLESGKVPLIALHGGPGIPHGYLLPLSLVLTDYGVPVIMYDQIGCGESTRFPDHIGDTGLWTPELFMAELDNLRQTLEIQKFDLLGQSWGGMLAALYTVTVQPVGLRKLIISNSPASMRTWMTVANKLRMAMPLDIQNILTRCEKEGKMDTPEYEAATNEFNKRHSCRLDTLPKELVEPFQAWVSDPTVCMTMFGASDFEISGSLKSFSIEEDLKKLTVEVVPGGILLMNGYFDVAQDECMQPFFNEPSAKVKWVRFGLSSHCPQLEETEKFIQALDDQVDNIIVNSPKRLHTPLRNFSVLLILQVQA
ncbi:L-amino acid amidase [Lachnellula hyalina]|uniref:L-amino acid amidase n=1 Tax=Lachnellula hyalina TaxID=1316788 RepID=A0A8H8R8Z0_9HELO|nr:L-amino acid amidase [Lachnellula hyalina]TVY30620.1 L-amino acid amidase [Lachnellula hyalina]